jgi:ParD-like antitoxin of type II bacterial toxin-antitoxin system
MPLPVKLSDAFVLDARMAAEVEQRSIAGQVEYWAQLGKLVDALLDGRSRSAALQRIRSRPLSELVATVGTPECDARLKAFLDSEPFPHFEPHPNRKGILVRTEADGTTSVGRFVDRKFVVEPTGRSHRIKGTGKQ